MFLFLVLFIQNSCKREPVAKPMAASVNAYVYAFTSGTISRTSSIRVRFTNPVVEAEKIGQSVESGIINFRPEIPGKGFWEDDKTLVFEPESVLNSKTKYIASVQLAKLYDDVPAEAKSFDFDFRTAELYFDVAVEGMEAADPNDLSKQLITGTLRFSDVADTEGVNTLLEAKQEGNTLPVSWEISPNQRDFEFTVSGVNRSNQASEVVLSWNGKSMGLKSSGQQEINVPSLSDFKVMKSAVSQGADQQLTLYFSDPLQASQDLKGLIGIEDYKGILRFNVDGNRLQVFPAQRLTGSRTVRISAGIRNSNGVKMKNPSEWDISFENIKPQLRLVGDGVIIPNSDGLIFPFEAVSLHAVDLEIFKIYDNNILQFLQTNQLDGSYELGRVGRIVQQKRISLSALNPSASSSEWTRYALDLRELMQQDENSIYQLRLGFRPAYASYYCGEEPANARQDLSLSEDPFDDDGEIRSIWGDYYGIEGYYDGYRWQHRDNPCFPAYYNYDNFISRNVISSNLGIMAKRGVDGSLLTVVTDIRTAEPLANARLEFYDYQQQLLEVVSTDAEGMARTISDQEPFVVVANHGDQKGYLRMIDGDALSVSRFDVSGAVSQKGLKGHIYAERGVWRPGDSLFLNFVLEDKTGKLPYNYPIQFELTDPRGQMHYDMSSSQNVNNVYPIHIQTDQEDPTGNWVAKVKAGGAVFSKTLKIETVKPNRLKIDLDFGKESLLAFDQDLQGDLQVNWLHGAPAQNLKAKVEMQLRSTTTKFDRHPSFVFDDPARSFSSDPQTIFDSSVDENGSARVNTSLKTNRSAPGKLLANFRIRAFEKGGDFSTDNFAIPYLPYTSFSGVLIPENKYGSKQLEVDRPSQISFVAVDEKGNPVANKNLNVGLYRVQWRWWWDRGEDNVSKYNSSNHLNALQKKTLRTNNRGEADWTLSVERWGRYLIRVCDEDSGHCSGDFFFAGYPWYEDAGSNKSAAAMLPFSADKDKYQVGETVKLQIPTGEEGRALVSIESGSRVVESFWVNAQKGENVFSFKTTAEMTPNVYAHVSLIQPHGQVKNDLPVRMYGIVRINVEDPSTRLQPRIKMADELRPEETFTVEVSENKGMPMSYTIAVVDDGLLDLTRFKTPNPWDAFYATEALGVQSWDMYDEVLGAYGGQLERMLSIGGDAAAVTKEGQKANRFKPVVMHLGPFQLGKGRKSKHQLKMPNYVGSVRTMVVASASGAYGNAEKTTPVRKPLMVLATLPRVLGPAEQLKLPVNVFAMNDKVRNVTVKVEETTGLAQFLGSNNQNISFSRPGDQTVNFDFVMGERIGVAKFKVTATSGNESASQEIELDVRNPNPYVTNVQKELLEAGESWSITFEPVGMFGTNSAVLEVSNIPPINLGERLQWLIRYPHGCIEQTTSAAFPQLFVGQLMELSDQQKNEIPQNINAAVDRLRRFQTDDGGFAYWPGDSYSDEWGTNYAGHFLLEAKNAGYAVPSAVLDRWKNHQRKKARSWTRSSRARNYSGSELMQAYRLYGLAMMGAPETGAMNRLREMKNISGQAKWRLAAAYALTGKSEVAKAIIQNLDTKVKAYTELSYTYGSETRDQAMILETLVAMGDNKAAAELTQDIAKDLSSGKWLGTQTIAYSLMAVAKFAGGRETEERLAFSYQLGAGQTINAGSNNPLMLVDVPVDGNTNRNIRLKNENKGILYARLISTGQPILGDQTAAANNLKLQVNYKSMDGKSLDVSRIAQGQDFIAEVLITNPGTRGITYEEMALTQIFPSGWEVHNTRMDNIQTFSNTRRPEYQDIRDDRVYSYFDIQGNKTHIYRVQLNAAYQGRYYLPTVSCEAMYDNTINARQPGQWVEVVNPEEI